MSPNDGDSPIVRLPHPDWMTRLQQQSREIQRAQNAAGFQPPVQTPFPITGHPLAVIVTGPGVEVDLPGNYSSLSRSQSSGSTADDLPIVYPGRILRKNISSRTKKDKYYKAENCWIEEINDEPLTVGRRYSGLQVGSYKSNPLVSVHVASGGAGVAKVKVIAGVIDPASGSGPYVTDPDTGIQYALATQLGFSQDAGDYDLSSPPYEHAAPPCVWLVPYWQEPIVGTSLKQTLPPANTAWIAVDMGTAVTLSVTLPSGGGTHTLTLAVYQTTQHPELLLELIRTQNGVIGNPDTGGAEITDPVTLAYGYYGYIEGWAFITGLAPPDDFDREAFLVPYYQEAIWGSLPDVTLDSGRAYPGKAAGVTVTVTFDMRDGPLDGGGNPTNPIGAGTEHIVTKTLDVYWFTMYPITGICEDTGPVWTGMGIG